MKLYNADKGALFGWESADQLNPTEAEYERNGLYCKSGLAFQSESNQAMCIDLETEDDAKKDQFGIFFQEEKLDRPYKCAPKNPSDKCVIKFEIPTEAETFTSQASSSLNFINTDCKCALTDQLSGFCSNVIGTPFYFEYTKKIR